MAALLVEGGRVLVAKRPAGTHLGGLWEFPGGKIEPGETPEAALVRELAEELDIEVRPGPVWGVQVHHYPERAVRLHFRFVTRTGGEPKAIGCDEVRWASPADLAALEFPEADRPLVDALLEAHAAGRPLETARPPAIPDRPHEGEDRT